MRPDVSGIGLPDLSAYLDGELDQGRRAAVEWFLAEHPEMAARLSEYRRRDAALRKAFDEYPAHRAAPTPTMRLQIKTSRWRAWFAAAVTLCLAVIAGGWWLYSPSRAMNRELAALMQDATAAHFHYLSETKAGSGVAAIRRDISPKLKAAMGGDVRSPDLSAFGFRLVGVEEFPDGWRPAVLFAYRDVSGHWVSCYFQLVHGTRETGFREGEEAGLHVSLRLTPRLAYAVVGSLAAERLKRIAEAADEANDD
jgi:anti-sigma factor RsiW